MDIKQKAEYEFLNLSDLNETDKNEIHTILKSHTASDVLSLPWDINENDVEYNEEHIDVPDPNKEWQSYDTSAEPLKYEPQPAMTAMPPMSGIPYQQYIQTQTSPAYDFQTTYCIPVDVNNIIPGYPYSQQFYSPGPATNDTSEMICPLQPMPMRKESRRGGRSNHSNKRGTIGMDNNYNRNHNRNHNHLNEVHQGFVPAEPNYLIKQMYPISDINGPQQTMAGTPIYTNFPGFPVVMPPVHGGNYRFVNNQKYRPNTEVPMMMKEIYQSQMHNRAPPKGEKHYHQRTQRSYRPAEEEQNSQPQTNILTTTTTKVTVGQHNGDVEKKEKVQSNGKNLPVDVKIEHTVVQTIGNSDGSFVQESNNELSTVNINSSVEVKQNGDEKKIKVSQSPVTKKMEEKVEEKKAPAQVAKVVDKVEEEKVQKVEPEKAPEPEVVLPKVQVQDKPSWASMLKAKPTAGSQSQTVKPVGKVKPLVSVKSNVGANTGGSVAGSVTVAGRVIANNGVSDENEKAKNIAENNNSAPEIKGQKEERRESNGSLGSSSQTQDGCDDPNSYRMGECLLNYQMDKQTVSLTPRGLTNRSNYCYINSILQALLACPPFYNLLMALPYSKNTSKRNSVSPLLDSMMRFVREFQPLSENARLNRKDRTQKRNDNAPVDIQCGVPFEPVYVYTMLKNTSSVFSVEGRQEDAEEFLSTLLNGICDEMLELMKLASGDKKTAEVEPSVDNVSQDDEEWHQVMGSKKKSSVTRTTEFGRTPLSDIFRGHLRSRIIRTKDQATDNVQPFFTLQLDIENAESVREAFEILVGKDQVEGMTCSKTKQQIEAWKQVFLEELPVILILHLKCFDYKLDGCSKILKQVEFPVNLKVDHKFLSNTRNINPRQKQYKLFAVTYHDGKEATKGHYLTDAFHVGYGSWVRYDDSSLKGVSENSVLKPQPPRVPYLLYYRRVDTIGNNSNNQTNSKPSR